MRAPKMIVGLAFVGLIAGCEPDPSAPEMDAAASPSLRIHAAPATGHLMGNNGAVVHKDEIGCRVPDGEGNWFPSAGWILPCNIEIATNSRNLNALIVIRASGVPNETGKTVHWGPYNPGPAWMASYEGVLTEGPYPCFLLGTDYDLNHPLYTTKWHASVTPSGEAKLICHYQKKWDWQWPS